MPDFFHINGATIVLIKGIEDPNQLFLKSCAFSLTWSNMHTPKLYLIIIYIFVPQMFQFLYDWFIKDGP